MISLVDFFKNSRNSIFFLDLYVGFIGCMSLISAIWIYKSVMCRKIIQYSIYNVAIYLILSIIYTAVVIRDIAVTAILVIIAAAIMPILKELLTGLRLLGKSE